MQFELGIAWKPWPTGKKSVVFLSLRELIEARSGNKLFAEQLFVSKKEQRRIGSGRLPPLLPSFLLHPKKDIFTHALRKEPDLDASSASSKIEAMHQQP